MRLNPLTWLAIAASTMLSTLVIDNPLFSIAVVVISLLAVSILRHSLAVVLASLAISVPGFLSMVLIHAPHGSETLWGPLTRDGLLVAGELGLRLMALVSVLLSAVAVISIPNLVKALSPMSPRLAYIIGASIYVLPQTRTTVRTSREAFVLRGEKPKPWKLIVPVITHVLMLVSQRGSALEIAGWDRAGRRTLLRPVPLSTIDRLILCCLPILLLGVCLWVR